VTRVWAPGHLHMFEDQVLPHATHTEVRIITNKKVSGRYHEKSSCCSCSCCCNLTLINGSAPAGEEMFTDYGGSYWFDLRNITLDDEPVSIRA
jgi:hypothetical protein